MASTITKKQLQQKAIEQLGRSVEVSDFPGTGDWKPGVEIYLGGGEKIVIHGASRAAARRLCWNFLQHLYTPKQRRIARDAAKIAADLEQAKPKPDWIDHQEFVDLHKAMK